MNITLSEKNINTYSFPEVESKSNIKSLITGIILIIASCALFYLSSLISGNMASSLSIFGGVIMICVGLYLIIWQSKHEIYKPSGSVIKKVRIFYASEDLYGLKNSLENQDVKSFEKFKKQHEGNVQLSVVYSKDNQYFAAQVLKYEPFEYKPQSDILIAEGETAARFIANIKN